MRYFFQNTAKDGTGKIICDATISVYLAGSTTVASIYTSLTGTSAVNSTTSGSVTSPSPGYWSFYTDAFDYDSEQTYKIVISKSGFNPQTYDNVKGEVVLGTYTISSAKTATTHFVIPKGVLYAKSGSGSLAINGPTEIGLYQVFYGFDAGDVTGLKKARPEWFATNTTPGTTSMTVAVQSAAKALNAGGILLFSPIIYLGPFTLDSLYDITLKGTGPASILRGGVTVSGTPTFSRMTFEDLCFDNAGYSYNANRSVSILYSSITPGSFGLYLNNSVHAMVKHCWFRAVDYGILCSGSRIVIDDNDFEICGTGIRIVAASSDFQITKNRIQQFRYGIYVSPATGVIDGLKISDNTFFTLNPFNEQLDNIYLKNVWSPIITGNRLFYPGQNNIYLELCDNFVITGNQMANAGLKAPIASAIKVVGAGQGSNLTYGIISGNNIYGPTKYGIELDSGSGAITIVGNNIGEVGSIATGYTGNMADISGVAHYGIYSESLYTSAVGNNFKGISQPTSPPQYDGSISGRDVYFTNPATNYFASNSGKDNSTNTDQKASRDKVIKRRINEDHTSTDVTGVNVLVLANAVPRDYQVISGGYEWQEITVYAETANQTLKHRVGGTDNIVLKGGVDITLTINNMVKLLWDGTYWRDL